MEQKQRLYIYDRKEMVILIFLGVLVASFAFTLGVHLGKRVPTPTATEHAAEPKPIESAQDSVPNRQELQDHQADAAGSVDETLSQTLHDEVTRTGIKLDTPRQVDLPKKLKPAAPEKHATPEKHAPAKSETHAPAHEAAKPAGHEVALTAVAASRREAPSGKFTLQVGSYNSVSEAKDQVDAMEALGLKPLLRAADIKNRGRWYRVYLGGYPSAADAEKAGSRYVVQHVIESFVVSKMID